MTDELKPCPFCGGTGKTLMIKSVAELEDCKNFEECDDCEFVCVVCSFTDGGCGSTSPYRPTDKEAIEAWNRRV